MKAFLIRGFWVLAGFAGVLRGGEGGLEVALLGISAGERELSAAEDFRALLEAELTIREEFSLVEREELESVLGEQALGAGGMVTRGQAVEIGRLTGARLLISGRLIGEGPARTVVLRVVSVTTGKTVAGKATVAGALVELAEAGAVMLVELVETHREELLPEAVESVDPLEALRTELGGSELPMLSISIPESHIGRVVPDPAAETELARILGGIGFGIGDEVTATVHLRGEAFSEGAAAVGGLVSCRARVEVIAIDASTGERVFSDAAEGVAVDVAEHVAGKRALVDAARELAPRLARSLAGKGE